MVFRLISKVSDNNFRKFDDPLGNETPRKYIFYAKTCDVPEGIPMSTNPRDQKLNSTVANAITESLLSNDGQFHLKNRGIILSAKRVRYDNRLQEVTIDFEDESCHGNIDGGHTYKILLENKDKVLEQYVQFEVMTGVEAMIADLAEARNTSIAVDAKSMAELREKFDPIKEGLEGLPFFNRISFKQNQILDRKALSIRREYLVCRLCRFDIVFGPHLEYEQHLFLALIASVSVFVGLPNLLFLLRTSFFGPSTAMVYWNIQCLFASD